MEVRGTVSGAARGYQREGNKASGEGGTYRWLCLIGLYSGHRRESLAKEASDGVRRIDGWTCSETRVRSRSIALRLRRTAGRQKRTDRWAGRLTSSSASTNAYAAFDMVDGPAKGGKPR